MKELPAVLVLLTVHSIHSTPIVRQIREKPADSYGPPEEKPASGPYPPSGWAPSGDLLLLPGETHSSQQNNYGPPPPSNNEYGAPTTPPTTTTTSTTTEANQDPDASEGSESQIANPNDNGQYYVFLPDGKLQKVQYSGKQRGRGQYEAQVQYEEVEPVRAPVYSYPSLPLQIPF